MHTLCKGDIIVHFEADEVFEKRILLSAIHEYDHFEYKAFWRLQVEQNFQRIRWYPELVTRVFPKGKATKEGHTIKETEYTVAIPFGFLWDVTNCFRDQWIARCEQQARLWGTEPKYRMVGLHANSGLEELTREQAEERLKEPHWTWTSSPLDLPDILKPLVGVTKYT